MSINTFQGPEKFTVFEESVLPGTLACSEAPFGVCLSVLARVRPTRCAAVETHPFVLSLGNEFGVAALCGNFDVTVGVREVIEEAVLSMKCCGGQFIGCVLRAGEPPPGNRE